MRRSIPFLVVAIVLAILGGVSLSAGLFERRMAIAQEDMAVLDFADPQADYAALEGDLSGLPMVSERPLKIAAVRVGADETAAAKPARAKKTAKPAAKE